MFIIFYTLSVHGYIIFTTLSISFQSKRIVEFITLSHLFINSSRFPLGQVVDGWSVSLTPPPLLSSWRGHLKGIVSLEYVERFRLIVTASLDCNVRLWTIAGSYIGVVLSYGPVAVSFLHFTRSSYPERLQE